MCGICGFVSEKAESMESLIRMNHMLSHRGPDDHGEEIYRIPSGRYVGFAHRRLSIIDLSEKGHQPMHSPDKRVSVIFNGEIYNYRELRNELKGYSFISSSDTEIIIAAYLKWGVDFIYRVNGMFAIAILDRDKSTVYLIRDRIGKKPIYYYRDNNGTILFASELKALLQASMFKRKVNHRIIGRFLYRRYITAPDTIYENTFKLEPGAILKITDRSFEIYKYWNVAEKYCELKNTSNKDYNEIKTDLKQLLYEAVKRRMIADVPIGAFLSGGYDSSLICALAEKISPEALKTFSIGFWDRKINEAAFAKQIAGYLKTDHEELYIDERDMMSVLESIPYCYDEPFADPSQIPTMLVSQLAKKKVSVVLSGDGGDELFGGYNIYAILQQAEQRKLPGRILYELGKLPGVKQTELWKKRSIIYRILTDDCNPEAKTQGGVNTYFDVINRILLYPADNFYYEFESKYSEKRLEIIRMLLDMDTYLPEDILTKVDRASMKYSLECRCPFLDKEVIEYSYTVPLKYKILHGNKKKIIKDIAYEFIPKNLLDRPKAGFGIPLDRWMRGILKERIMDWSNRDYLVRQGIFDPDNTVRFIDYYMKNGDCEEWSGKNFSKVVWAYFIFQQWYQVYENTNSEDVNKQMKYEELEAVKNNFCGGGYKCLFGAGMIGCTWAYDLLKAMGFHIDFYCDNNKTEGQIIRDEIKVISPETLYSLKENVLVFITVDDKYQDEIRMQLVRNGIKNIIDMGVIFLQKFIESLVNMDDAVVRKRFSFLLDDGEYVSRQFKYMLGYELNLQNPKTMNEKIQWLKLYDRNPLYTKLADKYAVREYISECFGLEYLVPLLFKTPDWNELTYENIPNEPCIIKTNHGCGDYQIIRDKDSVNWKEIRDKFKKNILKNIYYSTREYQYKNMKPFIIIEKLLLLPNGKIPDDYKLHFINGECEFIYCSIDREGENYRKVYDINWKPMEFVWTSRANSLERLKGSDIRKPAKFDKMLEIGREISKNIRYVRVDFYEVEEHLYCGEITFHHGAGYDSFYPVEYDLYFGKKLCL